MKRERGVTTVEFAIVGLTAMVVLFGVIEVSRALFVWNTLAQVTQRGARLAVVCPVNHSGIKRVAMFSDPGGPDTSPVLNEFSAANLNLEYLDADGVLMDPPTPPGDIRYVRASIADYQHTMIIPLYMVTLGTPAFATTLPIESRGWVPEPGGPGSFQCFGTAI